MEYIMGDAFGIAIRPLVGLYSVAFSPFSMAFVSFSAIAYLAVRRLVRDTHMTVATLSMAAVLLWMSLFLSMRALQWPGPVSIVDPIAAGGYPLPAFLYPHPPMGGDVPPLRQWAPFFLNYAFWIAVAVIAVPRLGRALRRHAEMTVAILVVAGVILSLYGLGDTLLRFD